MGSDMSLSGHSTDGPIFMYLIITNQMHGVCKTLFCELWEIHHEPNRNLVSKVEISKANKRDILQVVGYIQKKFFFTLWEDFYLK